MSQLAAILLAFITPSQIHRGCEINVALHETFCKLFAQRNSTFSSVNIYNQFIVPFNQVILLGYTIFWLHSQVKSYAYSGFACVIGLDICNTLSTA
ncbi:MAG: hypothetical protein B6229_00595 [Spirochaetaceae bacterium 4572_7]|nr:MAG: hypothetical protein B6229_00595 [Spirochaetaceae bacterium 4572_7]